MQELCEKRKMLKIRLSGTDLSEVIEILEAVITVSN